jgi:hypothetical protein
MASHAADGDYGSLDMLSAVDHHDGDAGFETSATTVAGKYGMGIG